MAVDTGPEPKACRRMNVQRAPRFYQRGNAQIPFQNLLNPLNPIHPNHPKELIQKNITTYSHKLYLCTPTRRYPNCGMQHHQFRKF
ncbi:MAG: hypothetical protein JWQ54_2630 [Mucilaginibacter sp.]|nr:hypothetical protein [Mucilaginibacter sp.]